MGSYQNNSFTPYTVCSTTTPLSTQQEMILIKTQYLLLVRITLQIIKTILKEILTKNPNFLDFLSLTFSLFSSCSLAFCASISSFLCKRQH